MNPVKISEKVYWVGGIDWKLRNFHGYLTQRGTTYNAYLILDDRITLIDTVKHHLMPEMLRNISKLIDPSRIEIIVSNHVEMDHSAGIPQILKIAPKAKVYASNNGVIGLKKHYGDKVNAIAVKPGEDLQLGQYSLSFVPTPMVHWPDNMLTYLPEKKILFSNDAFGQHIASVERFDDEIDSSVLMYEAEKYYANIVLPYGAQVQKALKIAAGLDIEMIAPSHGIIFRKDLAGIIGRYQKWSSRENEEKAVVIYDTMWGSTEKMAHAIAQGFSDAGKSVSIFNTGIDHISDVMVEVLSAKYICIGSPTLNNNILPSVAAFLTYLKGLAPKGKIGIAFGSYGWGGQSPAIIHKELEGAKFTMPVEPFKVNYIPSEDDLSILSDKISKLSAGEN